MDQRKYRKLISTFTYYTFEYIDAEGKVSVKSYAFPYLSLYPKTYFRVINGRKMKKNSLYTNTTAHLDLIVDIKRPVDKIIIQYDSSKFSITHDPFPLTVGSHKISAVITCLEEIESDYTIEVIASHETPTGETRKILAGGVVAKSNKKRYEIPVVFIEVKTDIGNGKSFAEIWAREHEIQIYLNQALINPVFKDKVSLDCSVDINTVSGFTHNRKSRLNACAALRRKRNGDIILNDKRHGGEVINFLVQELETLYPNKYDGVLKVFVMNEQCKMAAGYALHSLQSVVLFKGGFDSDNRNVTTHEIMHALGLPHTFEKENKFVFRKYSTDNIMDYSDTALDYSIRKNVYTTTHWQWSIMQNNARKESSSSRYFKHPDPVLMLSF